MLSTIVRSALNQGIVVVVIAVIALAFGVDATYKLSVDAFPDVTNIQVQVATEAPGRSPDEVERIVTIPVEIGMTGLPGLTEMRSQNEPGLSIVTLVFTDDTPVYFARQLVAERLGDIRGRLPEGIMPVLGPVSTALSEVYQYTIESPNDGERALTKEELVQRRIVQDWVARPLLRSISGVAEINSTGEYVKQYQVLVDPIRMQYYGVTIHDVYEALARNNANSSGGILPRGPEIYLVRGIAVLNGVVLVSYIRSLRETGMDRRQAIVEGAKLRFRPVMMTATVAALGLVPFLFATGPGSEVQRPLAIVVIGGLITSTLLTLVVVPALYSFFDSQPAEAVTGE